MLYVTTRNHQDAFTAHRVLTHHGGDNDGLFLPLRFPVLSAAELKRMTEMSFNHRIAEMLNLFFSTSLTGWDVDFSIGRYPVRLEPLPHRILMAETWHNPRWNYANMEDKLMELINCQVKGPGSWISIAVRMAILAAMLTEHPEHNSGTIDISAASNDFSVPVSAWYLRKMGFPIGNIVCCCKDSQAVWDLICLGQMKTDSGIPANLERLIADCGGEEEAKRYLNCCRNAAVYSVPDPMLKELRRGLYVSVVSSSRIETTIPNVYRTHNYVLQSGSAMAYSGLMDYRAKTGAARSALVVCDESPLCEADFVAQCMNLPKEEIIRII